MSAPLSRLNFKPQAASVHDDITELKDIYISGAMLAKLIRTKV